MAHNSPTFKRGEAYLAENRVLSCDLTGGKLHARVAGQHDDYQVSVWHTEYGLTGHCSCFMQFRCKHMVATALFYLKELESPDWVRWLSKLTISPAVQDSPPPVCLEPSRFHLLYQLRPVAKSTELGFIRAYLRQDGVWTQQKDYLPQTPFSRYMQPEYIGATDLIILQALYQGGSHYAFKGAEGYTALILAQKEQRLLYQERSVQRVPARTLSWEWQQQGAGKQLCGLLEGTQNWCLLETEPPCFIDLDSACMGLIESNISCQQIAHLLRAPLLPQEAWLEVARTFTACFTPEEVQPPLELNCTRISEFTPHLHLQRLAYSDNLRMPALDLTFDYGSFSLAANYFEQPEATVLQHHDGEDFIIERDADAEAGIFDQLSELGLILDTLDEQFFFWTVNAGSGGELIKRWNLVLQETLPVLAEQDWHITVADDFNFQVHKADFSFTLGDAAGGWFNLSLDVGMTSGEKLDTGEVIRMWLEEGAPEHLYLPHSDGWLEVDTRPLQQIHSLLKGLILDQDFNQPLKLPLFQAAQLHELPELNQRAAPVTSRLMAQLNDFRGIEPVKAPAGLQAELREYQQQGLNWLHFLHRHQFGGILADDMGLGKTLQVLAFIASLKEQQQLQQPALVVAPTSLLGNWQREAARFTPRLRTLVLHGTQRTLDKALLEQADIILTSYALLHLDGEFHQQQAYALAVLDEAQAIKNPDTKTASSARQLNAGMRLCLSGTPLENHLGELWSLLDFALPGLLYGQSFFNSTLRNPIERNGDAQARQELARKIAPFVLRRTKQQVAAELPEKTLITQYVELGSKQAALYESVRLSMEKHIRDLIDKKGLAKSHIEFLDALLKLRQACIAPQLVKLAQAKNIHESAKLGWLADTLPAMLEEGRRVLIFSQFTQALGLVEEVLKKQNIGYSKLTGATRKRQEAIDAFQLGDTPVFLISLKAGGSGLNLTRADTVIHLDPWWNPAVENQATDRAHRIGQDKPVFVYKLVASGTVEERIQQMQEQKQALADALFDSTRSAPKPESAEELLSLLAH